MRIAKAIKKRPAHATKGFAWRMLPVIMMILPAMACNKAQETTAPTSTTSTPAPSLATNVAPHLIATASPAVAGSAASSPAPAASQVVASADSGTLAPARLAHMTPVRDALREKLGGDYNKVVPPGTAAQLKDGEDIFASRCATCHGDEGHGDGPQGAALKVHPADLTKRAEATFYSDAALLDIIHNGVPGNSPMPAWSAQLSDDDIMSVFQFVRSLRGKQ